VRVARVLNPLGINRGMSGNVSTRCGEGFLVTPSAVPYDRLSADEVVAMRADGTPAPGARKPSTEWPFHRAIYAARPEVAAVVHTHGPFTTTLACLRRGIPAFHYMVAKAGGSDIRCAPYATFGSQALAEHVVAALDGRDACLLANHGMIAVGTTLERALGLAVDVESLAETYWRALQVGEPPLLDEAEMQRVVEQFRHYGSSR
jgi:L-fuculose-phosphate aldolase